MVGGIDDNPGAVNFFPYANTARETAAEAACRPVSLAQGAHQQACFNENMNRRPLEKQLRAHGCLLNYDAKRQDVWVNPATQAHPPIPRHTTIKSGTVKGIYRILGVLAP
jgi:hypothetical protein